MGSHSPVVKRKDDVTSAGLWEGVRDISPSSALFPKNFHKVEKYVYPYISSVADIHKSLIKTSLLRSPPSPAGGGPGGNPDLYTPLLTVSASVTNIGTVAGAAVVQLYVAPDEVIYGGRAGAPNPIKDLYILVNNKIDPTFKVSMGSLR